MNDMILKEECYRIMGACFEVYRERGSGFLEAVYQECLELELGSQGIPFEAQRLLEQTYKGRPLQRKYEADLVCFDAVLVELNAVEALADEHRSQVLNYLNSSGLRLGLLVNFGHAPKLEWERLVR